MPLLKNLRHLVQPRRVRCIRYDEGFGELGFKARIEIGEFVEVWTSSFLKRSPHVLYTNLVEPILRWTFVKKGYALVHAACLDFGEDAYPHHCENRYRQNNFHLESA